MCRPKKRLLAWWTAGALLLAQAGLLSFSATRHSPTRLEPALLASGLSHWTFGRFELYRVNPPLVRMVAAIPVLLVGYQSNWNQYHEAPGSRSEFVVGPQFIEANGERSIWLLTLARWACIPFVLAGGLFCYLWSNELWSSRRAGLVSLCLWCTSPSILAHGELITNDVAAASFGVGASYAFWKWLKARSVLTALSAGGLLGVGLLCKTSWLPLVVLWPMLWLLSRACPGSLFLARQQSAEVRATPELRTDALQVVTLVMSALYVIHLGYGFDSTLKPLSQFTFVSQLLTGHSTPGVPGNRFTETRWGDVPIPLPEQLLLGVDAQTRDFEQYGRPNYLRGEWKTNGGWLHYYLYGLMVKVPHGVHVLLAVAALQLFRNRPSSWISSVIVLSPAVTLFALVSSQTAINEHFRYALPAFGPVFVYLGSLSLTPAIRHVLAGMLTWTAASMLFTYPHSLAYFNEYAGGPANGSFHLHSSSLDWSQDLLYVRDWQRTHSAHPLTLTHDAPYDAAALGLRLDDASTEDPFPFLATTVGRMMSSDPAHWPDSRPRRRLTYTVFVSPATDLRYTHLTKQRPATH